MAAFDLEDTARQGRSGVVPPTWKLFPVSRSSLWLNLISYGLCALFLLGLAAYLLITGSAYVPGSRGNNTNQTFSPLEAFALIVLTLLLLRVVLRLIPPLRRGRQHFFLVTPQGFVLAAGARLTGFAFTEVRAARRDPGLLGAKLVIQRQAGRTLTLPIGAIYGARALREMEDALSAGLKAGNEPPPKRKKGKKTAAK